MFYEDPRHLYRFRTRSIHIRGWGEAGARLKSLLFDVVVKIFCTILVKKKETYAAVVSGVTKPSPAVKYLR